MADTKETVRYDVIVELKASLLALKKMSDSSRTNEERIKKFADTVVAQSKRMNVSLETLYKQYEKLNRVAVKKDKQEGYGEIMGKGGIFGAGGLGGINAAVPLGGGQSVINAAKAYNEAGVAAGRLSVNQDGVASSSKRLQSTVDKTTSGVKKYWHGLDITRIALGNLIAMGVSSFFNAIAEGFTKSIELATKFELALYNLSNAERILSKQGTDIAPQDLTDIIDNLQKVLPTLSRIDATNAVSQIAIFTKGLGLSKEQIQQLSEAAAVLAVKNRAAGLSFQQVFDQLKTGLLTGTTRGITDLGVNINAGATKLEAMRIAGVKTEEEFNKLNDEVKEQYQAQAILAIVYEQTTDELGTLNEYLDTNDAKLQKNKSSWEDLLTTIGVGFANVLPNVTPVLEGVQKSIEVGGVRKLFLKAEEQKSPLDRFKDAGSIVAINAKLLTGAKLTVDEYEKLKEVLSTLPEDEILRIFPDPSAIKDRFTRELVESLVTIKDTATATGVALENAFQEVDTTKAQEELKDLLKDLENLKDKMDDKEQDYGIDLARFDEDALEDRSRAVEDYNLNVLQATRAYNIQKTEANQKYRQRELEDERKFQESMRKLQEDFLYNLEDALRERDARQVLRLIDKYNMEKEALVNENALRKQASAENQKIEETERRAQLDEKLRVMAEEQALKLQRMDEDSALKRQRMEEDHVLEMSRMREQLDERIQQAAEKIAEEYGINAEGAQAIFDLLSQYYGTDGALAQLTANGYNTMLGQASGFLAELTNIIGQAQSIFQQGIQFGNAMSPYSSPGGGYIPGGYKTSPYSQGTGGGYVPGFAKGGKFVATHPQKIMVGEGGEPELVTITPLSQLIEQNASLTGNAGATGESGQTQISVMVDLSPDLEARIVNKAMDNTASVISTVRRGK